ncbi:hypothetical protein GCM10027318_07960 [Massilia agilis]
MCCWRLVFPLFLGAFLSGCHSIPTKEERARLDSAREQCNYVNLGGAQLTLKAVPVVNGKSLNEITAKLGNNTKSDYALFAALWHQDACMIQRLAPSMDFNKVSQWDEIIADAFAAVPNQIPGDHAAKLETIRKLRSEYLARLDGKDKTKGPLMPDYLYLAAIPADNFLNITEFHSEIALPDGAVIKGTNLAKSALSADLGPGEFSNEVRPALQVIRSNLAAYALGHATEQEILQATVTSIFNVATNKVRLAEQPAGPAGETKTPASSQPVTAGAAVPATPANAAGATAGAQPAPAAGS